MANIEEFLKEAASAFVGDCCRMVRTATAPVRIGFNELEAVFHHAETSSRMSRQRSFNRAQIYKKFVGFTNHFASSPDRDGKLVYYFLCNIEALPSPQREAMLFKATSFIDSEPEIARLKIAEAMQRSMQHGLLELEDQPILALGNS